MDLYAQAYDQINQALGGTSPQSSEIAARIGRRQSAAQWLSRRASETEADARRMGNIQVEEENLAPWLTRAFPGLSEQEATELTTAYTRERGQRINMGRIRFHADRSRTDQARGIEGTVISAAPVLGNVTNFLSARGTTAAVERIRSGEGTDQDYRIVGLTIGDAERMQDRGVGREIIDTISGSIGFGGELLLGGPTAALGRAGGARLAGTIGGRVGAIAGRIAPETALRGTADTAANLIPSTDPSVARPDFGDAAYRGYTGAAIEGASEMAGGPVGRLLGRLPVVGRVFRALTPGRNSVLARAGFHGIAGEYFEERLAELGHGGLGIHHRPDGSRDFGLLGNVARGEWEQVARQSLVELGAFGTMGLLTGAGWGLVGRRRNRNLQNGPALLTMPALDQDADLDAMQPGYTDRQGNIIPQQTLRDRYAAIQARVDARNYAVVNNWLNTTPTDTLNQWVGQFGITQSLVDQRRERDRLSAEAVEHAQRGVSQQEYEAHMRQGLDRIQREIQAQSSAILGEFRTGLQQVRDELFQSEESTQTQPSQTVAPQETAPAVQTQQSQPVPQAPAQPVAPQTPAAPTYTSQTAQEIHDAFGALGSGLREASEQRNQELLAQQGYVGFRKPVAADAFQQQHPNWIREEVDGESRFRPAPASTSQQQTDQAGQDLDRLTILAEFANVKTPEQAAELIQKYGEENLRRQNIPIEMNLQAARVDPAAVQAILQRGVQQPVSRVQTPPAGVQAPGAVQTPPGAGNMLAPKSEHTSQQPVSSVSARPTGVQTSEGVQTSPDASQAALEDVFTQAFPNGVLTPRGEYQATVGGRTVFIGFDQERNVARLDFEADKPGVPAELQPGSIDLLRAIRKFIVGLQPTGIGLEYRAIDTNRGVYRRSRADVYAKMAKEAGYEQTGGPGIDSGGLYVWKSSQETPQPSYAPSAARVTQPAASSRYTLPAPVPGNAEERIRALSLGLLQPGQKEMPIAPVTSQEQAPHEHQELIQAAVDQFLDPSVKKKAAIRKSLSPELQDLFDEEVARRGRKEIEDERAARIRGETSASDWTEESDPFPDYSPGKMDERKPRGRGTRGQRGLRPGEYASPGGTALPSAASNAPAPEPITQTEMIYRMSRRFQVPWIVHNVKRLFAMVYRVRPRVVMVNNMNAGEAPVFMHEVAHHIDTTLNLFPDINVVRGLPRAVAEGIQSWDYDPANHDETTSTKEGFAEYLRMAVTGELYGPFTPEQVAASQWIETRLGGEAGLKEKLEATRADFARFAGMTSELQAVGGISTNIPGLTEQQTTLTYSLRKKFENDQIAIEAYERQAERMGKTWLIRPSEVLFQLRYAAPKMASEMLANGVYGYTFGAEGETLSEPRFGLPWEKIIEGALPQDLAPLFKDQASRIENYIIARHLRDEKARGIAEQAQGLPATERSSGWVSDATMEYYERAWAEMQQDAGFVARAEPIAKRFTDANNAMLDARVAAKLITQQFADELKARYPTFAPIDRVPEPTNWKRKAGARSQGRKESLDVGLNKRMGSDLQILAPFKAYQARLSSLSTLLVNHAMRMAVIGTFKTPGMSDAKIHGMGGFLVEVAPPVVANRTTVDADQLRDLLEKAGADAALIEATIGMNLSPAELLYFTNSTVPINGKPHIVVIEQGQPHFYRVADKELYELLIGQNKLPELEPLKWFRMLTRSIKFGATSFNPVFQAKNIVRDSMTFARNTMDITSAAQLPGQYRRAYGYFVRMGTGMSRDDLAKYDPWMTVYLAHAGEWTRQITFNEKGIDARYREMTGQSGAIRYIDWTKDKVQDLIRLISAGEHAPRVLEMKNYLLSQGFSQEQVERVALGEQDVIPTWQLQKAMVHAAEVTVPFARLGYVSRWLNLYIPFFGPTVAGLSKGIRQAALNPKRIAAMTAVGMAIELLHWLANKDDPDYEQDDAYGRANYYTFRVGNTRWRIPKSREPEMIGVNLFGEFLRLQSNSNPRFAQWAEQSVRQHMPNFLPAPFDTLWEIQGNRDWAGRPIVDRADENMSFMHNLPARARYAASQLTGGVLSRDFLRNPFGVASPQAASLQDFYSEYTSLEQARTLYGREHRLGDEADYSAFPQEQTYRRLHAYQELMRSFAGAARNATNPDRRWEIAQARANVSAAVMGQRTARMPPLSSLPEEVKVEAERWMGSILVRATTPADPDTQRRGGESLADWRARSARADAARETQRAAARTIISEWNLSRDETNRLLRETLRRQGYGADAIARRVGRLR